MAARTRPVCAGRTASVKQRAWTLLVQGVDLYDDRARALLDRFRFVPDARLDDLMISYATDGGGVGPHFDSYDVFLLQVKGKRRWRISAQNDLTLQAGLPLKVLQNFEPEAGMGARTRRHAVSAAAYRARRRRRRRMHDVLDRLSRAFGQRTDRASSSTIWPSAARPRAPAGDALYRDPQQAAVERPAALPAALGRKGWRDPCWHQLE